MRNLWFRLFSKSSESSQFRLIAIPYAGGSATLFKDLKIHNCETVAVQLPGRQDRLDESLIESVDIFLDSMRDHLEYFKEKPFFLFGYSMGALIAYELAHFLNENGIQPLGIIVAARSSVQCPLRRDPIHDLPKDQFIKKISEYGGTVDEILKCDEIMEMTIPILRADFKITDSYVGDAAKRVDLPLLVLGATEDQLVCLDDLMAWEKMTSNRCKISLFEGGHFFLRDQFFEVSNEVEAFVSEIGETHV